MWPLEDPARHDRLPGLVDESSDAVRIIRVTRYHPKGQSDRGQTSSVRYPKAQFRWKECQVHSLPPGEYERHQPTLGRRH